MSASISKTHGGIPPFEPRQGYPFEVLPDGVFACDEATLRARFVHHFPSSTRRPKICDGFLRLCAEAAHFGLGFTLWVDGSFVEAKPEPGDVDLVSFIDAASINALPPDVQDRIEALLNAREATKALYHTHTFLLPTYPQDHPDYADFERNRSYWRKWWGTTRDHDPTTGQPWIAHPKGFIEMTVGVRARAPSVSHAKSTS